MKQTIFVVACVVGLGCGDEVKKRGNVTDNNGSNNTATNNANNTATNNANNTATNNANNTVNNTATNNANNTANNTATNNANNSASNNATNNANNAATNNANNAATNNANNTATNNATNNANNTVPCGTDPNFFGQISNPTTGTYTTDAGLMAVYNTVSPTPDDPNTLENEGVTDLAVPIQVNNALVTATGFTPSRNFWVQDRNRAIEVYVPDLFTTLESGQIVSFRVLQVTNYEGHPEITGIDQLQIHSFGNPVPYRDASNRDVNMNDYGYIVKVGGPISNPYSCGGTKSCYELEHNGYVNIFRTGSTFVQANDCVTFVGPARSFPGPLGATTTPTPQLDTINFDWYLKTNP